MISSFLWRDIELQFLVIHVVKIYSTGTLPNDEHPSLKKSQIQFLIFSVCLCKVKVQLQMMAKSANCLRLSEVEGSNGRILTLASQNHVVIRLRYSCIIAPTIVNDIKHELSLCRYYFSHRNDGVKSMISSFLWRDIEPQVLVVHVLKIFFAGTYPIDELLSLKNPRYFF